MEPCEHGTPGCTGRGEKHACMTQPATATVSVTLGKQPVVPPPVTTITLHGKDESGKQVQETVEVPVDGRAISTKTRFTELNEPPRAIGDYETWQGLGTGFPPSPILPIRAAFDVLAPVDPTLKIRQPIYELGHERTPTPRQVWSLAGRIANAVRSAVFGDGPWQIPPPPKTCTTCGGLREGGDRGDHLCWCPTGD